ncbi:MAG: CbtA family protein [Pseudomonadota bacterium]|nr:CbtA family protein [Pseudomonadota bacterium]
MLGVFSSGLFAGLLAGVFAGFLQLFFVQPVLLHAELYETGKVLQNGAEAVLANPEVVGLDIMRDSLSLLFSVAIYCGFGLILVSLMALATRRGFEVSARKGVVWGIAGFVAVHLAPGFSLFPELPGMASGDLFGRQIWWYSTVLFAVIGIWIVVFSNNWKLWVVALVLLFLPHVIGAPHPIKYTGPAPTELGSLFSARVFGVTFLAWVILGLSAGYFWAKESSNKLTNE